EGSYIGSNAGGTAAVSDQFDGISIDGASGNTIGGTTTGANNVIAGSLHSAILIGNSGATANLVEGNYIGTNAAGTAALGNSSNGSAAILILTGGNTIGGTAAGAGNLISGNNKVGVLVYNAGSVGNTIQGNLIGTSASGNTAIANGDSGITIDGSANNTIGG